MTRPLRTSPLASLPGEDPIRPGWYHLARQLAGTGGITDLRNALIDAAPTCERADADLFTGPDAFTEEPEPVRLAREEQAKALCAGCPARPECLAYALAVRPEEGVWAGLTASELLSLTDDAGSEVA
ncbi:WhiB family transcriptional regulator [Sphaerisporangium sp. NPDC004334]